MLEDACAGYITSGLFNPVASAPVEACPYRGVYRIIIFEVQYPNSSVEHSSTYLYLDYL